MFDGLVVVDKPAGCTSHDVVAKLRKACGQKRGRPRRHPRPGRDRRAARRSRARRRACCASCRRRPSRTAATSSFGVATDTLDAAGRDRRPPTDAGDRERSSREAMLRFVGDIEQVPPMVSALQGRWSSPPRDRPGGGGGRAHAASVRIDTIDARGVRAGPVPAGHDARRVLVAAPTSARSPPISVPRSADPRTSASLRRLRVGSFTLDEAHPLDGDRSRPRRRAPDAAGGDARPGADDGRRGVGPGGRPRFGVPERRASGGRGPGPVRGRRRPTARCSRSTSAGARPSSRRWSWQSRRRRWPAR